MRSYSSASAKGSSLRVLATGFPLGEPLFDPFGLPLDENFNSASFRDELANALGVPVDSVRITANVPDFPLEFDRFLSVAIIDLTTAQETEVLAFFNDNPTFILDVFGTVRTDLFFKKGE